MKEEDKKELEGLMKKYNLTIGDLPAFFRPKSISYTKIKKLIIAIGEARKAKSLEDK